MRRSRALQISLIDRRGRFGPGLAYSTANPQHLLNVCAEKMSLIEDEPDMEVVAEAANGREAIERFRIHRPDVTPARRLR